MYRGDVSFILSTSGFIRKESDGGSELYEMVGNNIWAHVVSKDGRILIPTSTVMIFHKDFPLKAVLVRDIGDLIDEIEKHPLFKRIR